MNIIKINKTLYKYESFWRQNKQSRTRDFKNELLPFPTEGEPWQNEKLFLKKLNDTHNHLKSKNRFIKYEKDDYKDCLICGKKHVTTGLFEINKIRWENGLEHYIRIHHVKPTDEFIDIVFKFQLGKKIIKLKRSMTLKGTRIKKLNKMYLKLDRNQILIMDALMEHGSRREYIDSKHKSIYRYSEHAGLLDFDESGLEKIIVSGKTTRVDDNDDEIFLPENMADAFDYEYIFHTHPATPTPGGRAEYGILYEFPSMGDLFHFMDHYNDGNTQGSIIIAAEGMYIIRKLKHDNQKIEINENNFYKEMTKLFRKLQDNAIKKYGEKFSRKKFFNVIAQDVSYIGKVNNLLNKFKIHVDYYPRIKSDKRWIIDTVYLPVYVVEQQ